MVEWFEKMQILVDADACPVVSIVEEIAEKYNIPSTLLCDTNHVLYSDYSEVIAVGAGADAVDYKLIGICHKDKDLLALIKYIAADDKLEKVLENPQVIKTPVVRNGKQSTMGYLPDVWKNWN